MNEFFDNEDVLTVVTAEKAVVGTKGFFSDSLPELIDKIKQNDVRTLTDIIETTLYCFEVENNEYRALFLPIDKVLYHLVLKRNKKNDRNIKRF